MLLFFVVRWRRRRGSVLLRGVWSHTSCGRDDVRAAGAAERRGRAVLRRGAGRGQQGRDLHRQVPPLPVRDRAADPRRLHPLLLLRNLLNMKMHALELSWLLRFNWSIVRLVRVCVLCVLSPPSVYAACARQNLKVSSWWSISYLRVIELRWGTSVVRSQYLAS